MRYTALLTITLLFAISTAYAQEAVRFQTAQTYKQKQIINFVSVKSKNTGWLLAQIDLNNDAIDEYIVRPQNTNTCPQKPLCPYKIVAFQNYKPILIGTFDAHKLLVSDKKTYGIRHIIVYNQSHNDFAHETATWNPFSFRFEFL